MKQILEHIHQLNFGGVNAYLIDHGELTLIDTGYAGNWKKISAYLQSLGKTPSDLQNILITHLHPDHTGSLSEIKKATGARIYMHSLDAVMVSLGQGFRPEMTLSPGLVYKLVYRFFIRNGPRRIEAVDTDILLSDGEEIPIGKGFKVIHTPGHSRGHVSYLFKDQGGVLLAGDVGSNLIGLGLSPLYEDLEQGYRDLQALSKLEFRHAVFGHGKPILKQAGEQFREKYGSENFRPRLRGSRKVAF